MLRPSHFGWRASVYENGDGCRDGVETSFTKLGIWIEDKRDRTGLSNRAFRRIVALVCGVFVIFVLRSCCITT